MIAPPMTNKADGCWLPRAGMLGAARLRVPAAGVIVRDPARTIERADGGSTRQRGRARPHPRVLAAISHPLAAILLCCAVTAGEARAPEAGAPTDWLTPLASAVHDTLHQQPPVQAADFQRRSSALGIAQAEARWSPYLAASARYDENRRLSTSVIDGAGVIVDDTTTVAATIGREFTSGTRVELRGDTSRLDTTSAQAVEPTLYSSGARVVVTQPLLDGASVAGNRIATVRAQALWADDDQRWHDEAERQFAGLARTWLDQAARESELAVRDRRLAASRADLARAEERARAGLGTQREVLSRRRDLTTQEAGRAITARALEAVHVRLAVNWPGLSLPARSGLATTPRPLLLHAVPYERTRAGAASRRRQDLAAQEIAAARSAARDRLDAELSYGKNGLDPSLSESWNQAVTEDAFRWSAALTYQHTFGRDAERLGLERAGLDAEQVRALAVADERLWRVEQDRLRLILIDARARVGETAAILDALSEEYRLLRAQAAEGLIALSDLLDIEQQSNDATLAVQTANLDTLRADVELRAHEDVLVEEIP